jgi:hypothetical protein
MAFNTPAALHAPGKLYPYIMRALPGSIEKLFSMTFIYQAQVRLSIQT